jgi:hypothetical protein
MHDALTTRLHDWRDLLAPTAERGARLDGSAVRELIGTLIAAEVALTDRVSLTIDLDAGEYARAEMTSNNL